MYAVIVYSRKVDDRTRKGEAFIVTTRDNWTTTERYRDQMLPPWTKIFASIEEADDFASNWEGHPCWCQSVGYSLLRVEKHFKLVLDGYDIAESI